MINFLKKNAYGSIVVTTPNNPEDDQKYKQLTEIIESNNINKKDITFIKENSFSTKILFKNNLFAQFLKLRTYDKVITLFIDRCDDLNYVDPESGMTPMHYICITSQLNVILHMTSKNIGFNNQNKMGLTPFHYICINHHPKTLTHLLTNYRIDIECTTNSGMKYIHYICKKMPTNFIMWFIKTYKPFLDPKGGKNNYTPMQYTFRYRDIHMINYFIEHIESDQLSFKRKWQELITNNTKLTNAQQYSFSKYYCATIWKIKVKTEIKKYL